MSYIHTSTLTHPSVHFSSTAALSQPLQLLLTWLPLPAQIMMIWSTTYPSKWPPHSSPAGYLEAQEANLDDDLQG